MNGEAAFSVEATAVQLVVSRAYYEQELFDPIPDIDLLGFQYLGGS